MAMPQELKDRFRAASKAKRAKISLLKDIAPFQLAVFAVDHFDEFMTEPERLSVLIGDMGRLSWATREQVKELQRYLPHVGRYFHHARLMHALLLLVNEPRKYLRWCYPLSAVLRFGKRDKLQQPTG